MLKVLVSSVFPKMAAAILLGCQETKANGPATGDDEDSAGEEVDWATLRWLKTPASTIPSENRPEPANIFAKIP